MAIREGPGRAQSLPFVQGVSVSFSEGDAGLIGGWVGL